MSSGFSTTGAGNGADQADSTRYSGTGVSCWSSEASSGLPVLEFCRQEGINAALFRRWHARLGGIVARCASDPAEEADEVAAVYRLR